MPPGVAESLATLLLAAVAGCGATAAAVEVAPAQAGRDVQLLIDNAILAHAASVVVPGGDYHFAGESLRIIGAHKLRISTVAAPAGASFWFDCGFGVHIANSSDVTFSGFVQDYSRPCFAQGTVIDVGTRAADTQWVDVRFDLKNFANPGNLTLFPWVSGSVPLGDVATDGDAPSPINHISVKATFWDSVTTRMVAHGNHLVCNTTRVTGQHNSDVFRVTFRGPIVPADSVQPGALATVHYRLGLADPTTLQPVRTGQPGGLTYLITNSSRITTLNHTVHGGGTEAIVEAGGEGGNVYRGIRVARREGRTPQRLLAANADGFHSSCVVSGPTLEDSEISWTGDDLLNIHSRISIVLRVLSHNSAYIIDAEGVSAPGDYDESTLMLERTQPGDTLSFFELGTLQPKGNGTITALRRVYAEDVLQEASGAYEQINSAPYNQRIGHGFGQRVWLVTWTSSSDATDESAIVNLTKFSLVDVPRLRNNNAIVRRNHMHDAYMRFGLYDSPGAIVEYNLFERGFPLNVGESGDGWLEGPPATRLVAVRNNTFVDCAAVEPPIVVDHHTTRDVDVSGNDCKKNDATVPCQ